MNSIKQIPVLLLCNLVMFHLRLVPCPSLSRPALITVQGLVQRRTIHATTQRSVMPAASFRIIARSESSVQTNIIQSCVK